MAGRPRRVGHPAGHRRLHPPLDRGAVWPSRAGAVAGWPRRVDHAADRRRATPLLLALRGGYDDIAAFLTAASSWTAFKILVACRLADDAKRALRAGCLDPCSGPTSLADLVAASASPKDVLWAGSPDVCSATRRLVHDAMGHWAPSRHFLFHAGVRSHIRVVLLCANRDQYDVPIELWEKICSFFLRSDWEAPLA